MAKAQLHTHIASMLYYPKGEDVYYEGGAPSMVPISLCSPSFVYASKSISARATIKQHMPGVANNIQVLQEEEINPANIPGATAYFASTVMCLGW